MVEEHPFHRLASPQSLSPCLPSLCLPLLRCAEPSAGKILHRANFGIMGTKEEPTQPPPKLVKLNNALKLAEQWVESMSGDAEKEAEEPEMDIEGRPARLGLGAKAPPKSQFRLSNDPVERRLQKKLSVGRRKTAADEVSTPSARNEIDEDGEDDENLDSRTKAFLAKKRFAPQTPMEHAKKKPK